MTTNPVVGWKFGADIKDADGRLTPRTCYVAIEDHGAARQALAEEHPDLAFHAGHGQNVSAGEWKDTFAAEPVADEVRCV